MVRIQLVLGQGQIMKLKDSEMMFSVGRVKQRSGNLTQHSSKCKEVREDLEALILLAMQSTKHRDQMIELLKQDFSFSM